MIGKEVEQAGNLHGLTLEQIDQSAYEASRLWEFKHGGFHTEFWHEAYNYLRQKRVDTNLPNIEVIEKSNNLRRFIERIRPETLFFEPAEIAQRLTSASNIIVRHKQTRKYEEWVFRLNPKRFIPKDEDDLLLRHKITYKKPLVDVDSGKFRPYHPEPYIVIEFLATYENGQVVFSPEIQITYGDVWPSYPLGELQKQMLILLGLPQKKVGQKLSFRLRTKQENLSDGETRNKYTVTVCITQPKS